MTAEERLDRPCRRDHDPCDDDPCGDGPSDHRSSDHRSSDDGDSDDGTLDSGTSDGRTSVDGTAQRRPLYSRLLRLRHLRLGAWQRALLSDGALFVAVLLVLADLATAWTLVVLPLAVAVVVKVHDVVAGLLQRPPRPRPGPDP